MIRCISKISIMYSITILEGNMTITTVSIQGTIARSIDSTPITGASVVLRANGQVTPVYITPQDGSYSVAVSVTPDGNNRISFSLTVSAVGFLTWSRSRDVTYDGNAIMRYWNPKMDSSI